MFPVFHRPERDKHVILGMKKWGLPSARGRAWQDGCSFVRYCVKLQNVSPFSTNHAIALMTSTASLRRRRQLCRVRRELSRTCAYARGVPLAHSTKGLTKKPNWHLSRRLQQHVYDTLLEIQNWHEVKNCSSNNAKRSPLK